MIVHSADHIIWSFEDLLWFYKNHIRITLCDSLHAKRISLSYSYRKIEWYSNEYCKLKGMRKLSWKMYLGMVDVSFIHTLERQ